MEASWGGGTLNLGSAAQLTLAQSVSTVGNVDTNDQSITIDNIFLGSDSAKFNVDLSDAVGGYEIVFAEDQTTYGKTNFTGTIALKNGTITAFDDSESVMYDPNRILTQATLELQDQSVLKVDGSVQDGRGEVKNLILNGGSVAFDQLNIGQGGLDIKGDLTLSQVSTIEINSFKEGALFDIQQNASLLDVDNGVVNEVINVEGNLNDNNYAINLEGDAVQDGTAEITQNGQNVATGTWKFNSQLVRNETNNSYDVHYSLAKVEIADDQTLTLTPTNDTANQDFIAEIAGDGNLSIDASGKTISIGNTSNANDNSYTGQTTVSAGTNVVLVDDNAFGETSNLIASGNVTLESNVSQVVKGLSGSGTITLGSGAVFTLAQDSAEDLTNTISGSGTFAVDLGGSGNALSFNQTSDFGGTLRLTNTLLDLASGNNASVLDTSHLLLCSGAALKLGADSEFGALTIDDGNVDISMPIVIGGDASLNISDALTINANTVVDVDSIAVKDDLTLLDYDQGSVEQTLILAGSIAGRGSLSINLGQTGQSSVVVKYNQTNASGEAEKVADTTWTVLTDLNQVGGKANSSFLLTQVDIVDDKTLKITSGDGSDNIFSALVTGNGGVLFDASGKTITINNASNAYAGATTVAGGTQLVVGASSALGQTSALDAVGDVTLNDGVRQAVKGLSGTGEISLGSGAVFTLNQNSSESLTNTISGFGTFAVDLGGSDNALTFTTQTSDFVGTLSLTNTLLNLASGHNASVLDASSIVLKTGALMQVPGNSKIKSVTLNEGTIEFGDFALGSSDTPLLTVTDLNLTGGTFDINSINIASDTVQNSSKDLFEASGGISQALIGYENKTGNLHNIHKNVGVTDSNIVQDGVTVAKGTWSTPQLEDAENTISLTTQLTQVALSDATEDGLQLDASQLTGIQSFAAKIVNDDQTAGNLTFVGGSITLADGNAYTGQTNVLGGELILASGGGSLGRTSLLNVEGGSVQFNGAESLGSLQVASGASLSGSGVLTLGLDGQEKTSTISQGANSSLSGSVILNGGHTLTLQEITGLGTAAVTVESGAKLELSETGTFLNQLSGEGTVQVSSGNTVELTSTANSGFSGLFDIVSNAVMTVSGSVANNLGSALLNVAGNLNITQEGGFTLSNTLSGTGTVTASAGDSQGAFAFKSPNTLEDTDKFAGTLVLDNMTLALGGADGSNNASHLVKSTVSLTNTSSMTVSGNQTLAALTTSDGTGVVFDGILGFGDRSTLSKLTVGKFDPTEDSTGTTNIQVTVSDSENLMSGNVNQSALLDTQSASSVLIKVDKETITEDDLANLTLNGSTDTKSAAIAIVDGGTTVAHGTYGYGLAVVDGDLGVSFDLQTIDILANQKLTLTGGDVAAKTLGAYITDTTGVGSLTIGSGIVELTGTNNDYSGATTVASEAQLIAGSGSLGDTSLLKVAGTLTNSGTNSVGALQMQEGSTVALGETLTIIGGSQVSTIAGTLSGAGGWTLLSGNMTISGDATDHTGQMTIGSDNSEAHVSVTSASGLGTGTIDFANTGSSLSIDWDADYSLENQIVGNGSLSVDLDSEENAFALTSTRSKFELLDLSLTNASFDLDNTVHSDYGSKLDLTLGTGSLLVLNQSEASYKQLYNLTLSGGTIDFGSAGATGGKITLSGGQLTINGESYANFQGTGQSTQVGENGTELLGDGVFEFVVIDGVTNVVGNLIDVKLNDQALGTDNVLQDTDGDGEQEHVATASRANASLVYAEDKDSVSLQYGFKSIELLHMVDNQGLLIDTSGLEDQSNNVLSAQLTGGGNIILKAGSEGIVVNNPSTEYSNNYTGKTYITGGTVSAAVHSAFGETSLLSIADGATVVFNDGVGQKVGGLAGRGMVQLSGNNTLTLNNTGTQALDLDNQFNLANSSTFEVNGNGQNVSFTRNSDDFSGNFVLNKANMAFSSSSDNSYLTLDSASVVQLGSGTNLSLSALSDSETQTYTLNDLTLSGGALNFTSVALSQGETTPILTVGHLKVTDNSSLSVAANIDPNFNILAADHVTYQQTLLKYTTLTGGDKLTASAEDLANSEIKGSDGYVDAYAVWTGNGVSIDEDNETIGLSYGITELRLADASNGGGLVLDASRLSGQDAELSVKVTNNGDVAGNLIFSNGTISIGNANNDYTGQSIVKSGAVLNVTSHNALGLSQLVVEGGEANLGGYTQSLGSLQVAGGATLSGSGALTLGLDGQEKTSTISQGANSSLSGSVSLKGGHTLTLQEIEGLGSAAVTVENEAKLVLSETGAFVNQLTGQGTVQVSSGSTVELTSTANSGFSGLFDIVSNAVMTVSGSVADKLGSALLNVDGNLNITQQGGFTLSNALSGTGTVTASAGTTKGEFAFSSSEDDAQFTGTLVLDNMTLALGGADGSNNASHLVKSTVSLTNTSSMTVSGNQTLAALTTSDGTGVVFDGILGFGDRSTLSKLTVGKFDPTEDSTGTTDIQVTVSGSDNLMSGNVNQSALLDTQSASSVLIDTTNNSLTTDDLDHLTLNGSSQGTEASAAIAIVDGGTTVAHGTYGYGLAVVDGDLGVSFDLQTIDILNGQTLTLTGTSGQTKELGAKITDTDGAGSLTIGSGIVELTGTNNDYSGATTVASKAQLIAGSGSLGDTSLLNVAGTLTNSGANSVGALQMQEGSTVALGETLTIEGSQDSTIAGTLTGEGQLAVAAGLLNITSVSDDFKGSLSIGNGAQVSVSDNSGNALGAAVINVSTDGSFSAKNVQNQTYTLTSLLKGDGTASFGLNAGSFVFGNAFQSTEFSGTLALSNGSIDLAENTGKLSNTHLSLDGVTAILNTGTLADQSIGNLTLQNSVIDFGSLTFNTDEGQINTSAISGSDSTVTLNLQEVDLSNGASSPVFESKASVVLFEGLSSYLDNTVVSLDTDALDHAARQDGQVVATLKYAGGNLEFSEGKLSAVYGLSEIELTSSEDDAFDISAEGLSGAEINAKMIGGGNVNYTAGTLSIASESTYEGKTLVSGATVTLKSESALGDTSELNVTSGQVNFNGTSQTVGALNVSAKNGLTGLTTLTVKAGGEVSSTNSDLAGTVNLTDSSLKLSAENALGKASVEISEGAQLLLGSVGEFANTLTGKGSVEVQGDDVSISDREDDDTGNSGFSGSINVVKDAQLAVNNILDTEFKDLFGIGSLVVDGNVTLSLANAQSYELGQALSGSGTLSVTGKGSGTTLSFTDTVEGSFAGSLDLTNVKVSLGGNTATNLATADVTANTGSILEVQTGAARQKLDTLKLSGGTLSFAGYGGANVGTNTLGQLEVASLDVTDGGTIDVKFKETGQGSTKASSVLTADEGSVEQMLVYTKDIDGDISQLTFTQSNDTNVNIVDETSAVAIGTYGYSLAQNTEGLGISFQLRALNLISGQTLNLAGANNEETNEANDLSAKISGEGNLAITGNSVYLENSGNNYSGSTTVNDNANLYAVAGALGKTSLLTVSGSFTNNGDNTVGALNTTGTVTLDGVLTVNGNSTSTLSGTLGGNGKLVFNAGTTQAQQLTSSDYTGDIDVADGADLSVVGNGIGTGAMSVAGDVSMDLTDTDASLSNTLIGYGLVTLTGSGTNQALAFNANQEAGTLTGSVFLNSLSLDLTNVDNSNALQSAAVTLNGSKLTVNSGSNVGNRTLAGLTIGADSLIDFGTISENEGQLDLSGKKLEVTGKAEISLNSQLSSINDADGTAGMEKYVTEKITLITNAAEESSIGDDLLSLAGSATGFVRDVIQNNETVAKLKGNYGDLSLTGDSTKSLVVGLNASELELLQTYTVSEGGEIVLKVTGAGNLTVNSALTLSGENAYKGMTSVNRGATLTLGSASALGDTWLLSVSDGGAVNFGDNSVSVKAINSAGSLFMVDGKTLTIAGDSKLVGASADLNGSVVFNGDKLTIGHVDALGSASLTWSSTLSLSDVEGTFDNTLSGADASIAVENSSDVTFGSALSGVAKVDVASGSKTSVAGDLSNLIGSTVFNVSGESTFDNTGAWTVNVNFNGSGDVILGAGGSSNALSLSDTSLSRFTGNLTLINSAFDLSANAGQIDASDISGLALGKGAVAEVSGKQTLSKDLTLSQGSTLVFDGVAVPGSTSASNPALLSLKNLTLDEGFKIGVGIDKGATVNPFTGQPLLVQDSLTNFDIIKAENAIQGDITKGEVTLSDGSTAGGNLVFDIVGEDGSTKVANGHYDFNLTQSDDKKSIGIEYRLAEVELVDNQTLKLEGTVSDDNSLTAVISGSGNLYISEGLVSLQQENSFTGDVTVEAGATLELSEGALGNTKVLTLTGTETDGGIVNARTDNTVGQLIMGENSALVIGSDSLLPSQDSTVFTINAARTNGQSIIDGALYGTGTLKLLGNADTDRVDLILDASKTDHFFGNIVLEDVEGVGGANMLVNSSSSSALSTGGTLTIGQNSIFTLNSQTSGNQVTLGMVLAGNGTFQVDLQSEDKLFLLDGDQGDEFSEQGDGFSGTLELIRGTMNLSTLVDGTSTGTELSKATLKLDQDALVLLGETDGDRQLGGLYLNGGTIEVGSLSVASDDSGTYTGAQAHHIDLNGGALTLAQGAGSTIEIDQNAVHTISDAGTEFLKADDGADLVLMHNIGSLVDAGGKAISKITSDYLQLSIDESQTYQKLSQKLSSEAQEATEVAEVKRQFADGFDYQPLGDDLGNALTIKYWITEAGLLHETAEVNSSTYTNGELWQGLTITTSDTLTDNTLSLLIKNASTGEAGNIVFRGNANEDSLKITGGNTYTGKTWITAGAQLIAAGNNAFGETQALRLDSGSSIDFNGSNQTVGQLYALGTLKGEADLTVTGYALLKGANEDLSGSLIFEDDTVITNAEALGSASVTVANTLTVQTADGTMQNTFNGSGSLSFVDDADIALGVSGALVGFVGAINVEDTSSLAFTRDETEDSLLQNVVKVSDGGTLSITSTGENKSIIFAKESSVTGTLSLTNTAIDLNTNEALSNAHLVLNNSASAVVSSPISDKLDSLTMDDGSSLSFESGAGTPGVVGAPIIDLGKDGTLNISGSTTVKVDVDLVNAAYDDASGSVTNLPLTAQDVLDGDNGYVLTNLVSADNVNAEMGYSLGMEVTGGELTDNSLTVGITDGNQEVARGTYDYKVVLDKDGQDKDGLNLSYALTSIDIHKDKVLTLGDPKDQDGTLSATVFGTGGLKINSGKITLAAKNTFSGGTTVSAGATLETAKVEGALGIGSLTLEGNGTTGATVSIFGTESISRLISDRGSSLTLQDGSSLTVGAGSILNGSLAGSGAFNVDGAEMTVSSTNSDYSGEVALNNGAKVTINSVNALGANNIVTIDEDSTLSVKTSASTIVDGVNLHQLGFNIAGKGTVSVDLSNADDYFEFRQDQLGQAFTGTLALNSGTYVFVDDVNDTMYKGATIALGENGTLDISTDNKQIADRYVGNLTLAGGTLKFGSLSFDAENTEVSATHVNLGGGQLALTGSSIQTKIEIAQDATNSISDDGSEILNATVGSHVLLIHNIGEFTIDGQVVNSSVDSSKLDNYLELGLSDTSGSQKLTQSIVAGRDFDRVVASVNRDFGDFSYEKVNEELGNGLYVNYKINEINLLYSLDSDYAQEDDAQLANAEWLGLTVSAAQTNNELTTKITGEGNIVFASDDDATDSRTLLVGNAASGDANDYTGNTWITDGAKVQLVADSALGLTSALRIDEGSVLDLNGQEQTVGALYAYGDGSLEGSGELTINGVSEITGDNSNFTGSMVFNTTGAIGVVNDVAGLGEADVTLGDGYTLKIVDAAGGEVGNKISGTGQLMIGDSGSSGGTIELSGVNTDLTGGIFVEDGWKLAAQVGASDSISTRIGTGTLTLQQGASSSFTATDGTLTWNATVIGGGELGLGASSLEDHVTITSGLDNFTGSVRVTGGTFDLSSNVAQMHQNDLAVDGQNALLLINGDTGAVNMSGSLVVENKATVDFGTVTLGHNEATPKLESIGSITLTDAVVSVDIDNLVKPEDVGHAALSMQDVLLADQSDDLKVVLAQAERVEVNSADLNNAAQKTPSTTAEVKIVNNGTEVATGFYDYALSTNAAKDQLGIAYQLTQVSVFNGQVLDLTVDTGSMSDVERENASVFSADIRGEGGISLRSGELTITSNNNSYEGVTQVGSSAAGTAQLTVAKGSSLGNTSEVMLYSNAALSNLAGSMTVGAMNLHSNALAKLDDRDTSDRGVSTFTVTNDVTNSGTIQIGRSDLSGLAQSDIGNTFVIEGDYTSDGGTFALNALLSGDDDSLADHVEITGSASGAGLIDVGVHDESTGGKLNYLELVSVEGTNDLDLTLSETLKVDDTFYRLVLSTDGQTYYLMSSDTDPGEDPWKTEDVQNVTAGAYSSLAFIQSQVFDLSLHDHIGETLYVDPISGEQRSTTFWMIQRGDWSEFSDESGQITTDGNVAITHIGKDLYTARNGEFTYRLGVLGSYANGDFDMESGLDGKKAKGSFDGWSIGAYAAFESTAESGPYGSLQLRYNNFDNEVSRMGKHKYEVDGVSVTAELGYDQLLSRMTTSGGRDVEWRLEPHVRAHVAALSDAERFTTMEGETFSSDNDNGATLRLGARTKMSSMKGTEPAVQAFAEANLVFMTGDFNTTTTTKYGEVENTRSGGTFGEFRAGIEVQCTPELNIWAAAHHTTGTDDYSSTGGMIGLKLNF